MMLEFQDLYESYAPEIYRFALWLAGDSFEAEDITSETFIRAWAHNRKIRTETLKAYLFTIARNVYLEHQRKRKPQVALEDVYTEIRNSYCLFQNPPFLQYLTLLIHLYSIS